MAPETASISVPATLEDVRTIAAFVREQASAIGLNEDKASDLELAVVEAANNIVLHAYAGRTDGMIEIRSAVADNGLAITLVDRGTAMKGNTIQPGAGESMLKESGRGIAIIRACADAVDYRRDGDTNLLTVSKAR